MGQDWRKGKVEDLTNRTFGRLKVIKRVEDYIFPSGQKQSQWLCECSCDNHTQIITTSARLKSGNTKSCGCLKSERTKEFNKSKKKQNDYDLSGEFGIGYTSNGTKFYFDLEDYDKIKDYSWHTNRGYIRTTKYYEDGSRITISMHNLLCPHNDNEEVDHLNRKKNDNRKSNLKPKTHLENMINVGLKKNSTSKIIGVNWRSDNLTWRAFIRYNGKKYNLGCFVNKIDAIKARLAKEKELFGNNAPQSHLFKEHGIE